MIIEEKFEGVLRRNHSTPLAPAHPVVCSLQGLRAAFARGDTLTIDQRIEASWCFRHRMSIKKACRIAVKYALGRFHESDSLILRRLTHAWIVLGEKVWAAIIEVTRAIENAYLEIHNFFGLVADKISDKIMRILPKEVV